AGLAPLLRCVLPNSTRSTPPAHQCLPGALAPTEIRAAANVQEGSGLLATHHPPATAAVRPPGINERVPAADQDDKSPVTGDRHARIRGSRGPQCPRPPGRVPA